MDLARKLVSSTYTPGARYSGIARVSFRPLTGVGRPRRPAVSGPRSVRAAAPAARVSRPHHLRAWIILRRHPNAGSSLLSWRVPREHPTGSPRLATSPRPRPAVEASLGELREPRR